MAYRIVAFRCDEGGARVQADANLDRARCKLLPEGRGGGDCTGRASEGEEERVSLRVDLDPALMGAGRANHPAVLGKRLGIALGAQ
jgi:hypothetical protein